MTASKKSKTPLLDEGDKIARRHLMAYLLLEDLLYQFPGFENDTDVNGADLVEWLSAALNARGILETT